MKKPSLTRYSSSQVIRSTRFPDFADREDTYEQYAENTPGAGDPPNSALHRTCCHGSLPGRNTLHAFRP
jgi:hypothetical protein